MKNSVTIIVDHQPVLFLNKNRIEAVMVSKDNIISGVNVPFTYKVIIF